MKINKLILPILRQLFIFLIYLIACSSLLFNHGGGADIVFLYIMVISLLFYQVLNLILLIYGIISKKFNYIIDFIIGIFLLIEAILFYPLYLDFMWWFTNLFV